MNQPGTPLHKYSEYKAHPHQFYRKITKQWGKNTNPLYSQQSLKKYFFIKEPKEYKEPTYEFYTARKKIDSLNMSTKQKIQKFEKLQALIRKSNQAFNSKKFMNKIDMVEEYVDKSQEHFKSLNLQDGVEPFDPFSRQNFHIRRYVAQLTTEENTRRPTMKQKIRQERKRAHAENIIEYLHQEQIQSRYQTQPKSANKVDQQLLNESFEIDNKKIRSKTEYCRKKYNPPKTKKQNIDSEILQLSRIYMKKERQKNIIM